MITAYVPLSNGRKIKVAKKKGCNPSYFMVTKEGNEQLLSVDDVEYNYMFFTNTTTQEQFVIYVPQAALI